LQRIKRDDTEHGVEYYRADEVDKALSVAEQRADDAMARSNLSWTHMCKKMVGFERDACAKIADGWVRQYDDVAASISRSIKARGDE
jgi:hypothetical protein